MKMFPTIVHHDNDSAYGLTFPGLTGCFAASDDLEGLFAAGAEALALWFKDQPQVDPVPLDRIDAGGLPIMLIPYVQPVRKTMKVNLSLPAGIVRAIDMAAKARGLTRSAFLAEAALAEIEGRH